MTAQIKAKQQKTEQFQSDLFVFLLVWCNKNEHSSRLKPNCCQNYCCFFPRRRCRRRSHRLNYYIFAVLLAPINQRIRLLNVYIARTHTHAHTTYTFCVRNFFYGWVNVESARKIKVKANFKIVLPSHFYSFYTGCSMNVRWMVNFGYPYLATPMCELMLLCYEYWNWCIYSEIGDYNCWFARIYGRFSIITNKRIV